MNNISLTSEFLDPIPPPENITSTIITTTREDTTEHGRLLVSLVLQWTAVIKCPEHNIITTVQYVVSSNNCGSCLSISETTAAVCILTGLSTEEQVCQVVIQTLIDGIVNSNPSIPYTLALKGTAHVPKSAIVALRCMDSFNSCSVALHLRCIKYVLGSVVCS